MSNLNAYQRFSVLMSNIKAKKEVDWQEVHSIGDQINKLLDVQKANNNHNDLFYRVNSDLEDAQRKIEELEQQLIQTQIVVTEIQELSSSVSCFVENLDFETDGRHTAFNASLEIGSKIRDLDLPEFTFK